MFVTVDSSKDMEKTDTVIQNLMQHIDNSVMVRFPSNQVPTYPDWRRCVQEYMNEFKTVYDRDINPQLAQGKNVFCIGYLRRIFEEIKDKADHKRLIEYIKDRFDIKFPNVIPAPHHCVYFNLPRELPRPLVEHFAQETYLKVKYDSNNAYWYDSAIRSLYKRIIGIPSTDD